MLTLTGTIDVFVADRLHAAAVDAASAADAAGGSVIVDCADAEHLDLSALQIVAALADTLRRRGARFALHAPRAGLRGYLRLAGLEAHFSSPTEGIGGE